ncbi:hypothetical protein ACFU99_39385, partial [Streptomyces sp. NPDC057654]
MDTDSTKTKTAKTGADTDGPADETPLVSKKEGAEDAVKEEGAAEAGISEVTETEADADEQDNAEGEDVSEEEAAVRPASSGVFAGAAAVVSAALGFAALSGTWLGTLLAERKTLTGQIKV